MTESSSLIKTDQELFDAALKLFHEYDSLDHILNVPQQHQQQNQQYNLFGNQNRPGTSSSTPSRLDEDNEEEDHDEQEDYDQHQNNNNNKNFHQPALTIEELEHRRAMKWHHTLEQHNKNCTFTPAICQRSLALVQHQRSASSGTSKRHRTPPAKSTKTPRNNGEIISMYQFRVQERELQQQQQQTQNQTENQQEYYEHQQQAEFENNVNPDDFVSRLYYSDAQRRRELEADRALQAEANRLLRQQEMIRLASSRATTPPASSNRNNNTFTTTSSRNASGNNIITSPNPRTPNQKRNPQDHQENEQHQHQQHEPYHRQTSGSVGVSVSERLYSLSQKRLAPAASNNSNTNNNKKHLDPALFERLHSDFVRMKEVRDQKIAEAYNRETRQLDQYALDALVERVYDEAIEERAEHMKHLRKTFTPTFHPEIEPSSARMVAPRNSGAGGDVFHRLAAKPPAGSGGGADH
jgi:hypothetical protein